MIISLVRLPPDGLLFEHQYESVELDLRDQEFEVEIAPLVSGRVDRTGVDVRVRGHLNAELKVLCDRCLGDVSLEVDRPFDLFYTPSAVEGSSAGEKELQLQDLDFSFFEGEEIDLDELVREQLALSLPVRVLCREDCRGLCSQCGAELNRETCDCKQPVEPRWQPLADLKDETTKKKSH